MGPSDTGVRCATYGDLDGSVMRHRQGTCIGAVAFGAASVVGVGCGGGADGDDAAGGVTSVLFVVEADGGSYDEDDSGAATLELTDIDPHVLFFSDRPERDTGVTTVERMLAALESGTSGDGAANAAVSFPDEPTGDNALAVELGEMTYDPAAGTLRATVRRLESVGDGLAHLDDRLDTTLPSEFGRATLFVDPVQLDYGNGCKVTVENFSTSLTLESSFKWDTDSWDVEPPVQGDDIGFGDESDYRSVGGYMRGCGNSTTWTTETGSTVTFSVTDPWSGKNVFPCTSSDTTRFQCVVSSRSQTAGDEIDIIFNFCQLSRQDPCPTD